MEVLSIDNKIMTVNGKLAKAPSTTGTGDMKKSVYDPTGSVATAGGIPDYVEANGGKIDTIKVNGTAQAISDKTVNITVPTKTSDITNDSGYLTSAPVTSVNSKTGAVVLTANDVGAVSKTGDTMTGNLTVGSASLQTNGYVTGTWLKTTANIASSSAASKIAVLNDGWVHSRTTAQIKSDIGLGNVDNVKQYSATNPPPYPVTRVNGKTGAVSLTSNDIGAATTSDIYTALNRTNAVNVANSNYTTYMARGEALFSYENTPSVNGTIAWQYE